MVRLLTAFVASLGLVTAPALAFAQGVVMQRTVSLAMARTMADAALAACHAKGYHTSVVVLDRSGDVLVSLRDEQAAPQTLEMARRKAYTSRVFRMSTLEFQKRTEDPQFAAQRDLSDILALGGGAPIQVGGEIIGAVGSAGSTQVQDDLCAKAALAAVADRLE
ncbi:MAG TPA: heme-binding protein [Vicinamibacterales bacterium]|nr:heme-binding protein [Vicinamibacterales bacterium]